MKKNLRYFMTLLLMMVASVGWAEEVTIAYKGTTTTNMTGENDATFVGLNESEWSVVSGKGGGNNHIGLNKDGSIRLYWNANGSSTLTVESLTGATINSITLNCKESNNKASVSVNGSEITGNNGEYEINASSFVIGNANTTNVQVHITSIVIDYTPSATPVKKNPTVAIGATTIDVGSTTTVTTNGPELTVTTSNDEVASVDGTTITGVAAGTATITATWSENAEYFGGTKTFDITVKEVFAIKDGMFDFTAGENYGSKYEPGTVKVQTGTWTAVNVTMAAAGRNCWYNGTSFRLYKASGEGAAGTMTFTVPSGKVIKKILFDGSNTMDQVAASTGTYTVSEDLKTGTWEGSANSVTFTAENATTTAVFNVITVTYGDGDEPPVVVIPVPTFNPEAGEVTQGTDVTITAAEGCVITYTTDGTDPTESTTATTTESNTATVTVNEAITIKAVAMDASDNMSAVAEAAYTIQGAVSTVTLPYTKPFTDNLEEWSSEGDIKWVSNKTYGAVVQGASGTAGEGWLISPIVDLTSATTPNMQFEHTGRYFGTPASEATLWVRSEDDDNWQQIVIPNYFTNNDWTFVTTTINLSNYVGEKVQFAFKYMSTASNYGKWEVKNLSIAEPTDPDAKGQKNNPYTVEEIQAMESTNYPDTKVWVKGYIVGVASSRDALVETIEDTNNTNVAISASGSTIAFVPVQLPKGDVRNGVNLFDNSDNLGKEVLLHGLITTYFETTGVKETDEYEFTGNSTIITESVDVNSSYGIGTYVTTKALDFSTVSSTLKAYYASSQTGSNVVFTLVEGAVPAKTPLLVKGTTTGVPVVASADAIEGNLLVAGTGATVASEGGNGYNFILNADDNGVVSFYKAGDQIVATKRAYLSLGSDPTAAGAKVNLIFSDEATGINNVNAVENTNEKIFNLAGQQMKSAVKGVYIKNGKKYVK